MQHHDAARRVEEEHDQEMDQRNKVHSKNAGRSTVINSTTDNSVNEEAEQSGVWQESEAGLEWVVIPNDKSDDNGKEDAADNEDEELRIQTSSQDDDENVTKGRLVM